MTLAERAAAIEKVVKGMTPGPWAIAADDGPESFLVRGPLDPVVRVSYDIATVHGGFADVEPNTIGIVALRNDAPQLVADLVAENEGLRGALRFYAERDNYRRQPVVADTMGANVPRDCPDKDAHAKTLCAGFTGDEPVIPHDCGLPNEVTDPRVSIVLHRELRYWGTPPVLIDDGAKARAALGASHDPR